MVIPEKIGYNLESVATRKSLPESLYVPFKTVVLCYYDCNFYHGSNFLRGDS